MHYLGFSRKRDFKLNLCAFRNFVAYFSNFKIRKKSLKKSTKIHFNSRYEGRYRKKRTPCTFNINIRYSISYALHLITIRSMFFLIYNQVILKRVRIRNSHKEGRDKGLGCMYVGMYKIMIQSSRSQVSPEVVYK